MSRGIRWTAGNFSAIISRDPSVEALSATMTACSPSGVPSGAHPAEARMPGRNRSRNPLVFQLRMTMAVFTFLFFVVVAVTLAVMAAAFAFFVLMVMAAAFAMMAMVAASLAMRVVAAAGFNREEFAVEAFL